MPLESEKGGGGTLKKLDKFGILYTNYGGSMTS